jgi:sialate O-acetylesterase
LLAGLSFNLQSIAYINPKTHLSGNKPAVQMNLCRYISAIVSCILMSCNLLSHATIKLPYLISDGMVLQRNTKLKIWGWADVGEHITVKLLGHTYKATAGSNGKWDIQLKSLKAGGPYIMDISGSNHIILKDILVGDVWFCSGQSNMVLNMERVKEKYPEEITSANFMQIRNFFILTAADVTQPHDDLPAGKWLSADQKNVLGFGAVTYFFAKRLYEKHHVPIGIINSSVGGTPIQAWISEQGLKQIHNYAGRAAQLKDTAYVNRMLKEAAVINQQYQPVSAFPDKGTSGSKTWYDTTYTPDGWHNFWLPGYWADQGVRGLNGVVWFRKEVIVPSSMTGTAVKLFLGRIIDADQTYVNGVLVGSTAYQYPPRRYELAAGLLKPGKNTIVVRVVNTAGKGGFVPDKPYFLTAGDQKIDLRGDWLYKIGQVYIPQPITAAPFSAQNEPSGLYNTMVAPVINYGIKGILWYQGESNTGKPQEYKQLLPALIADWRSKWQRPSLTVLYAQLPNFGEVQYLPSESQWAELREAQLQALSIPNTGMAVSIDAGEWNDIHPLNKKDIGERLALLARRLVYNEQTLVASGPLYYSAIKERNKIVVTFSNTGSGLISKGGSELTQFAIAGADKKFVWANAVIRDDKVVVWNDAVKDPLYVRYAWADNPEGANLYNKEGLPASPFQTNGLIK